MQRDEIPNRLLYSRKKDDTKGLFWSRENFWSRILKEEVGIPGSRNHKDKRIIE